MMLALKKTRSAIGSFALVLCVGALMPLSASASDKKPNILWITVEDITTFVGVYGDHELKTPNIDQLAKEGILYSRAHTVIGVCAPSRASFITGMYPTSVGAQHMRTEDAELSVKGKEPASKSRPDGIPIYSVVLPPEVRAFPELLRKAGYYTSNNQKTDYQFIAPVTVWDENSQAASYRNRPKDKPFFSVFNFFMTHESQVAMQKQPLRVDPAKITIPPIYPDTPGVRNDIARMYSNIEIMDQQVGELIKMLKDDGLYDNTIIFLFSDNGGSLPWMKREVLERGTRVPLIIRMPGGPGSSTTDSELVSGVDFAPTVLSLAGVKIPSYIQGRAFLGAQRAPKPRKYVYGARDRMDTEYDRVRMVRDKHFRYLYNYMPELPYYQPIAFRLMLPMMRDILKLKDEGKLPPVTAAWFKSKPVEELYDTEKDPWELHNLAQDPHYKNKLVELRTAFHKWTQKYGDMGAIPEKDMLKAMWNGGDHPPVTAAPEIKVVPNGVRISSATPGASIGYWIEGPDKPPVNTSHLVLSWDYGKLASDFGVPGWPKNGERLATPQAWNVYGGEVVPLKQGETLHVEAMRIGYEPSRATYPDLVHPSQL